MWKNVVNTLAPSFWIGSSSYLQVTRIFITSRMGSKFGQMGPRTAELAAHRLIMGKNVVTILAPSFLIQSSSFLQVARTGMKAWMISNFGQIPTTTPVLSALARQKN